MKKKSKNKYQVTGNIEAEYVDAGESILVNKLKIDDLKTLYLKEEEGLAKAYELLLSEVKTDTPMTAELLCYIHARIFGEIYEWAGRWRTVQISKPGAVWPPPHYLDGAMQNFERNVLDKHPSTKLQSDEKFCEAVGGIQGEFLAIHPFREGNARTIKLMTDIMAAQSGKPFLIYDSTEAGKQQYIDAAKAALNQKEYRPMTKIIQQALLRARN